MIPVRPAQALVLAEHWRPLKRLLRNRDAFLPVRERTRAVFGSPRSLTRDKLSTALASAAAWSWENPGSMTLIAYQGHGSEYPDARQPEVRQGIFLAQDARVRLEARPPGLKPDFQTTDAFSDIDFVAALDDFSPEGLLVVLLDCCYAAGLVEFQRLLRESGLVEVANPHSPVSAERLMTRYASVHPNRKCIVLAATDAANTVGLGGDWMRLVCRLAIQHPDYTYEQLAQHARTPEQCHAWPVELKHLPAFQRAYPL